MLSHPFTPLLLDSGCQLIFTPCPGTQEADLMDSLLQLQQAGAKGVITLMPTEDMEKEGVMDLADYCQQLGLIWFHFPVEDDCAPEAEFEMAWSKCKQQVMNLVQTGQSLAVHCKGGTGRTGLMIAIILAELGCSYSEIVQQVQGVRPKALRLQPHLDYLQRYVEAL